MLAGLLVDSTCPSVGSRPDSPTATSGPPDGEHCGHLLGIENLLGAGSGLVPGRSPLRPPERTSATAATTAHARRSRPGRRRNKRPTPGMSECCRATPTTPERPRVLSPRSGRAPLAPSRTQADPRRRTSAQFGLRVLRRTRRAMASQSAMRAAAAETPTALGVRAPSCPAQLGPFVLGHASCVLLNICPYAPRPGPAFGRAIRRRLPRRDGASPR